MSSLKAVSFAQDKKTGSQAASQETSARPQGQPSPVLPRPEEPFAGRISRRAKDSTPDFPREVVAPKGAPNILVILTDDVGFGATSPFGGPVPTATMDRLAKNGLRYTQFHTTALCSPTRAALLSGRNHHSAASGVIMELGTGFPGYNTLMPKSCGTFAEVLKQNGYNTAWYGKNHNVPDWHSSQAGPFDLWPTGLGFEYFYGFIGGDTNQWQPAIYENTKLVEPPHDVKDYFFEKDMADHCINRIRMLSSIAPEKPWLQYYAPGTAHAPHHAPKDWIARFKGRFDQGWDKVREETFARQRQMGIIPQNAKLTERPKDIPAWDSLDSDHKKVFARMMEVYAAALTYADHQMGRILDAIEGVSMAYTFANAKAPSRHRTQYFEMAGNRGIYDDGWVVCTTPPVAPWVSVWQPIDIDDYQWELYHVAEDFSESVNLADKEPGKLHRVLVRLGEAKLSAEDEEQIRRAKAAIGIAQ